MYNAAEGDKNRHFGITLTSVPGRRDARCNRTNYRYFDFRQFELFCIHLKVPSIMFSRIPWLLLTLWEPATGKFHRMVAAAL